MFLAQQEEARKRAEDERRQEEEAREAETERRRSSRGVQIPTPYWKLARRNKDDIRAAYEETKMKCDPAQVSHLGDEVQEHFR